jgi:flavorubredoxin
VITDPGSRAFFQQVWNRVAQILPPTRVRGMVISHQDPDIAASMVDWLEHVPDCEVLTSPRANVLLPHYGQPDYRYFDISAQPYQFASGRELQFIESPFLHFPGAFTTYDPVARCLFSSDIWAALDVDWKLVVEDFDDHAMKMNLFHMDYMASNLAARGFAQRLDGVAIDAILPQHGSIIGPEHVDDAIEYLAELRCGTDIIYADLDD